MANNAIARVTGRILTVRSQSGTSRVNGAPYSMTIVSILVGDTGVTELVLPRDYTGAIYKGLEVDLLVEFSVRSSAAGPARLGATVEGDWPVNSDVPQHAMSV